MYDWRRVAPGYIQQPSDMIRYDGQGRAWIRRNGYDSEKAVAFLPANDAFGKIKEAMRELWNYEGENLMRKYGFINQLHDDLTFEIRERDLEEGAGVIKEVMERRSKLLVNEIEPEGLKVGVELKVGKNWGFFNDDKSKGEVNLGGLREMKI